MVKPGTLLRLIGEGRIVSIVRWEKQRLASSRDAEFSPLELSVEDLDKIIR